MSHALSETTIPSLIWKMRLLTPRRRAQGGQLATGRRGRPARRLNLKLDFKRAVFDFLPSFLRPSSSSGPATAHANPPPAGSGSPTTLTMSGSNKRSEIKQVDWEARMAETRVSKEYVFRLYFLLCPPPRPT
jgi:hypothetical protein